jgi:LmbE family N-acetylglucosaminyl deacetylase
VSEPHAPLLLVSPHLDDAVFSCGRLLSCRPGSVVATLFAGRPPGVAAPNAWDAACGFAAGDDVVAARRAEDAAALALLGATPAWLDFLDAQYDGAEPAAALAAALAGLIERVRPAAVLAPLGLFHSDHRRARDAALAARRGAGRAPAWYLYADLPYARMPGAVADELAALCARGLALEPVPTPAGGSEPRKQRACACYRSQLRGLSAPGRLGPPRGRERLWRLAP